MTPERWELLKAAVGRARKSPYYGRALAGARMEEPGDFAKLPFTMKQDVANASPFELLAVPPARAWHYHESSGTTGKPVSTWCGLTELARMAEIIVESRAGARRRRRDAAEPLPVVRADPFPDGGGAAADGALPHRRRQHELGRAVRPCGRVHAPHCRCRCSRRSRSRWCCSARRGASSASTSCASVRA